LRILLTADIHGNMENVRRLAERHQGFDAVIVAGDITNFGGAKQAQEALTMLAGCGQRLFAVCGNCDLPEVAEFLENSKWGLEGRSAEAEGYVFVGAGGSLPCPGKTPNEVGEDVLKDTLGKAIAEDADCQGCRLVLVTHQPPWGTRLDQAGEGKHAGSVSVKNFIEKHCPALAISGHIHEAVAVDTLGQTMLVNPGPLRAGLYALAELGPKAVKVELKSLFET